jgi:hypothetical protein
VSKVRRLNAGIKTDKLDAPNKAQIMSSRDLQENFDAAARWPLYQDFIAQSKTHGDKANFNVSGFEGGGGGEGRGGGWGDTVAKKCTCLFEPDLREIYYD